MYNLIPALKSYSEPSMFFNFFFLRRTSDDFLWQLNLIMVQSPLVLRQSSRLRDHKEHLICSKCYLQPIRDFLSSTKVGMLTISRHSLLWCSCACRLLSSDVIRSKRLSFTVLVATRDDSTWASLFDEL